MTDPGNLAIAAEWIEADPRRRRWLLAAVAGLLHAGALLLWLTTGPEATPTETTAVLGIWAAGLLPVVRLAAAAVGDRERPLWLLADGAIATTLILLIRDVGNPLVFQRAIIPIAVAFVVAERRLGWTMALAFAATLTAAATLLPAAGAWEAADTGMWLFWAAIPLVLCAGPFMLVADARRDHAELRDLRSDLARLRAEARASHRAEVEQQAQLRAHGQLHNRETGWLVDVAGTLAEHIPHTADPGLRRRLTELHAAAEAAERDARDLLDELGGDRD